MTPGADLDAWLPLLSAARARGPWHDALAAFGSAAALVAAPPARLRAAEIPPDAIARLQDSDAAELDRWRGWLAGPNRRLVTYGSPSYPALLARCPAAPLALWVEGARPELLAAPQIAIVGSRNATHGGRRTAEEFARFLGRSGLTITSGLAAGIDAASHTGALHEAGGTIAVFGCGIDTVFPRTHAALARSIAATGLLVSEYPPGVPPLAHQFPARNRIIAGLSVGTLVVEAGRHSGSLITARWALDYGREVFAIPGSIHNPLTRGCHALIRQGAKLVEEGADILVEIAPLLQWPLPIDEPDEPADEAPLADDDAYANLLKVLEFQPVGIAELGARSGLTTAELSSMLLVLELEGFVEALPGGRYCRVSKRSR